MSTKAREAERLKDLIGRLKIRGKYADAEAHLFSLKWDDAIDFLCFACG